MNQIWMTAGIVAGLLIGEVLMAQTFPSTDTQKCDTLYAKRGAALFEAAECYQRLLPQLSGAAQLQADERTFIALSTVVTAQPKTPAERQAIDRALQISESMKSSFENTADYRYWQAVWVSFDAIQRDRGSMLPRAIFKNLRFIQTQLRHAMELNPAVHGHGPARVLGLMHTQMPGIVGGDKVLAEKLLKSAYEGSPSMSANQYAYANILSVNGKRDEAKRVLNRFLSMSDAELDPYPGEPLRSVKSETDADRAKARALLNELNSSR
jgi:tetratricopeptide (TPR) repeat protein